MNKSSIYKNIVENYNISSDYYGKINFNIQDEKTLMNIIFSKYITDTTYNNINKEYIKNILRNDYIYTYDNENFLSNTNFYEDTMNLKNKNDVEDSSPHINTSIIDFDMIKYTSDMIRSYFFYIDIIVAIYEKAYLIKDDKGSHKVMSEVNVPCRYVVKDNIFQLYEKGSYEINMKILRTDDVNNAVKDIKIYTGVSEESFFQSAINTFKPDIIKHLNFMQGEDVAYSNRKYLKDISYFYKFCRLKLMYAVIQSIYLLSLKPNNQINISEEVSAFMKRSILPVFINFKQVITLQGTGNNNDNSKNVSYNTNIIETTNKLETINRKILQNKDKISKNKKINNVIDNKTADVKAIQNIATVVLVSVVIVSIVVIVSPIHNISKGMLCFVTSGIVFIGYMVMLIYLAYRPKIEEKFNTLQKFPRKAATFNNYSFVSNSVLCITRVEASSNSKDTYKAFNANDNDSWSSSGGYTSGNATKTYRNDYQGEYLKIDTGDIFVLKNFTIKIDDTSSAPKLFQVYGSNHKIGWSNINHESWKLLGGQQTITAYDGKSKNITITNDSEYRFYMIIVKQLLGASTSLEITEWELYGEKKQKTVTLRSQAIGIPGVCCSGGWPCYPIPDIELPADYNDDSLISWDIYVYAYKNWSSFGLLYGCFWLNIGTFCLPDASPSAQHLSNKYNNLTTPLNINNSRKITGCGGCYSYPLLSNCFYEITLRYSPSIPEDEIEEIIKNSISDALEKEAIAKAKYEVNLKKMNDVVLEVNNLQKQYEDAKKKLETDKDNLQKQYEANVLAKQNESKALDAQLLQLETTKAQKLKEASEKEANAARAQSDYTQSVTDTTTAIVSVNDLLVARQDAMSKLEKYLTATEKAELAQIAFLNAENAYNKAVEYSASNSTVERVLTSAGSTESTLQNNLAVKTAAYNSQIARLEAERTSAEAELLKKEQELAAKNAKRLTDISLAQQLNAANTALRNAINAEKNRVQAAQEEYNRSVLETQQIQNNVSVAIVGQTSIGTSEELQLKIQQEKELKAKAELEASQELLKQRAELEKKATAEGIINTLNPVIDQIESEVRIYDAKLTQTTQRLNDIKKAKQDIENQILENTARSRSTVRTMQQLYNDFDLRTNNEILELRQENQILISNYIQLQGIEKQKEKEMLEAQSDMKKLEEELSAQIKIFTDLSNQVNAIKDITEDYKIYYIIKDIDVLILNNLNNNINGINHDLVTPFLKIEKSAYDKYASDITSYTNQSNNDINVRKVDVHESQAIINLYMLSAFTISSCLGIYYHVNSIIAIGSLIGLSIFTTLVYNVQKNSIVRTKSKNKYWSKPATFINNL